MDHKIQFLLEEWKHCKDLSSRHFQMRHNMGLLLIGGSSALWSLFFVKGSTGEFSFLLLAPGVLALLSLFWITRYTTPFISIKSYADHYLSPLLKGKEELYRKKLAEAGIIKPKEKGWSYWYGFPFQHGIIATSLCFYIMFEKIPIYFFVALSIFILAELGLWIWYRKQVKNEIKYIEYWRKLRELYLSDQA